MRTFFLCILLMALMVPLACAQAAETPAPPTGPAEATSAPAKASGQGHPADARADAAEARYRAWLEREHAKDAAAFTKERSAIEDKYKGYVRPPKEKKDAKPAPAPKSE